MAFTFSQQETKTQKAPRFNSELVVALAFNLAAWLVVGVIAVAVVV